MALTALLALALALAVSPAPADESAYRAATQLWLACLAERAEALDTPMEPVDIVVDAAFAECAAPKNGLLSAMMPPPAGATPEALQAATLAQLKASNREWLTGMVLRERRVRQMNERAQELHSR